MTESAYTKARDEQPVADEASSGGGCGGFLPCSVCGTLTARAALSLYGARCVGCYRTHQRATPKRDPRLQGIDEDAGGGPLAWARRVLLRAQRHVDPPSRAAQDMAAEALRQRGGGSE